MKIQEMTGVLILIPIYSDPLMPYTSPSSRLFDSQDLRSQFNMKTTNYLKHTLLKAVVYILAQISNRSSSPLNKISGELLSFLKETSTLSLTVQASSSDSRAECENLWFKGSRNGLLCNLSLNNHSIRSLSDTSLPKWFLISISSLIANTDHQK